MGERVGSRQAPSFLDRSPIGNKRSTCCKAAESRDAGALRLDRSPIVIGGVPADRSSRIALEVLRAPCGAQLALLCIGLPSGRRYAQPYEDKELASSRQRTATMSRIVL